ncbi:hypothetical protein R3W88_032192 [Solanum pinnatisectum]|uniref:Uncharacterized protein n=1 Tax=Solanum pinnatisectum TaxID=50273 RepID=A0AAV9LR40_9SOLN|nr:hypothetical protein R3W88_032192 [Solanum pinnatisectum]
MSSGLLKMQICKTNKIVKGKGKRSSNDGGCLLLLGFTAHGVEDVRSGFSVSMRRRRKGLFWGGDFRRFGGEWWLFGGVSDVVHRSFWLEKEDGLREVDQWGRFGCFLVTFWLEKRGSKGWSVRRSWRLVVRWFTDCFPPEWASFRDGKWVMVTVKTEKMGSCRGGCLVAGQQCGEERKVRKMGKQRLKLLLLPPLFSLCSSLGLSVKRVGHGFKNG